ncbi:MAG: DUF4388 domain-containing protein, partial [Deltaproteobacteria bacterium]
SPAAAGGRGPVPPDSRFRLKGEATDDSFFGPVTLTNFERLLESRAVGDDEHVSVNDGEWVRLSESEVRHLDPYALPDQPVHGGPLRAAWLPRLFHQLATVGATGMLQLSRGWVRKELHYRDGALMHIESNVKSELLATVALNVGAVSGAQVAAALHAAKTQGVPIGEGLVAIGAIDEARLAGLLREQQRRRFIEIFGWRDGTFAFYDGVPMPANVRHEPIDVLPLMGLAVRAHYSQELLREILEARQDRAIALRPAPLLRMGAIGLTEEETAAVEAIAPGWTVRQALGRVAETEEELHLLRAMFLMLTLDVMHFAPEGA